MNIGAVKRIDFQDVIEERGRLTAIEVGFHIPFDILRVFYVHQVVKGVDRGGHAHRETDQVLTAVYGTLKIDASDGIDIKTFELNNPAHGIYVPRMLWIRLYDFSPGAVCLVLANSLYDRSKSIRTWKEYLVARELPWIKEPGADS